MQPVTVADSSQRNLYVPAVPSLPVSYSAPYPTSYTQLQATPPQSAVVSSGYMSPTPPDANRPQTMPPRPASDFQRGPPAQESGSSEEEDSSDDQVLAAGSDMLTRQSTSYKMHKAKAESTKASFKRPQWYMLIFGNVLCLMAGIIDVGSIKAFDVPTTHVTGNTAKLGLFLENESVAGVGGEQAKQMGFCVLFFGLGSFLCGLIIPKTQIHFGGKGLYGTALIAECVLLLCAKFWPNHEYAPYWAAMAAGLQNAMCTMHFGAIVRTTHVTGTMTDIGSTSGRAVMLCVRRFFHKEGSGTQLLDEAELHIDKKKLMVLVPLYMSFFLGCVIGAGLYRTMQEDVFLIPAVVTGVLGLVYSTLRETLKKRFKMMEKNQLILDMNEIQQLIDRTQTTLRRLHHRQGDRKERDVENVDDLDDQLRQMADRMHDVQGTIGEMYDEEDRASAKQTARSSSWS
ncbi:unnamed protein product [Symbiodinium natans]|uniref:Uncharacterized protein n=1 Tax=Symbiodinium natans TaxID=878477 RepID=A0A812MZ46_9DINO|nr:unnamed protein product [Symbiodinium natans]